MTNAPVVSLMDVGRRMTIGECLSDVRIFLRKELSEFRDERFAQVNPASLSFRTDAAAESTRAVMCSDHELHQRAETPNGRRAKEVQSRHG